MHPTPNFLLTWPNLLRVASNKQLLFRFLAASLAAVNMPDGKIIVATSEERAVAVGDVDVSQ